MFQYFCTWDAEKDKGQQILNLCFCLSPRGKCSLSSVACFFLKHWQHLKRKTHNWSGNQLLKQDAKLNVSALALV